MKMVPLGGAHLQQGLKLGVFMDWELRWDVAFILPVDHQGFSPCTHISKGTCEKKAFYKPDIIWMELKARLHPKGARSQRGFGPIGGHLASTR